MNFETHSHFRTIELGTQPCDPGTLLLMTVKSPALRARGDISIYLPKGFREPEALPVVVLLHGVWGSHWVWCLKGGAHLTLQELIGAGEVPPMILAMPSDGLWGDSSGYLSHGGQDFGKWITEDVPHAVSEATGNSLSAPHFISGLSMGGFGAMRLGASHPGRFAAFAGHSSITEISQIPLFVEESIESYMEDPPAYQSILGTLLTHRNSLRPFRFDCGVEDQLIESNRKLHLELRAVGIEHEYAEHPGGHEWTYWKAHLADSLRFFSRHLA